MAGCRLHEEVVRAHFITRRFDRTDTGGKLHMQSLRNAPLGFDIACAWNPDGSWTDRHQMSLNSKRDGFTKHDLLICALRWVQSKTRRSRLAEVQTALLQWPDFAAIAGVSESDTERVKSVLRALT